MGANLGADGPKFGRKFGRNLLKQFGRQIMFENSAQKHNDFGDSFVTIKPQTISTNSVNSAISFDACVNVFIGTTNVGFDFNYPMEKVSHFSRNFSADKRMDLRNCYKCKANHIRKRFVLLSDPIMNCNHMRLFA